MRKRLTAVAALAATFAITLSACSTPDPGSTGGNPDEGIDGTKILIAMSSSESGVGSYAAAYASGVRAYLEYVNEQGGVDGYTFDLATIDNAGNASGGAQAIRQIVQRKPFFVTVTGSSSFQASVDVLKTQAPDLPVVGFGNAQIVKDSGLENAFGFFPNYSQECYFQVDFALEQLHASKLALVYEDSALGQGPAASCPAYAEKAGATQFDSIAVPPPAVSTNYGPIAAQVAEKGPDAVLFFGSNTELVGLQKAAFGIGADAPWIGLATSYDVSYFELAGQAGVGTYFDAFAEPVDSDTPEAELFRTEMSSRAPNANNTFGGYGWSYGHIIELAVKQAIEAGDGTLTRDAFVEALKSMKAENLGLLYSVDYTKDLSALVSALNVYEVTPDGLETAAEGLPIPAE